MSLNLIVRTLALAVGFSALLSAQAKKEDASNLPVLTVCEILSNPLKYDGQLIRIRDIVRGTAEGNWFVGDDCPNTFEAEGYRFPSLIWPVIPGGPLPQLHTVDFSYDFASQGPTDTKVQATQAQPVRELHSVDVHRRIRDQEELGRGKDELRSCHSADVSRFRTLKRRSGSIDPEIRRRCNGDSQLHREIKTQTSSTSTLTPGAVKS